MDKAEQTRESEIGATNLSSMMRYARTNVGARDTPLCARERAERDKRMSGSEHTNFWGGKVKK